MKTYNEIDIKYYDNDGNIQVRCSAPVTQDALVHYELMQSHYCKLSFKLSKPIYFLLGDFIDTPYGRFELIDLTKAKDNDTIGYSYEILFDAYYRKFKNKILKYRPNTGSQEATFSLTSTISTHVEVIMKSLAYYAKLDKSYLYDPKFEGEGTDYTYVIDASVDANAAKLITYSNTSMLDAIANIAQTFGCEWWFEGNILHFGTCENTNAITDFRLNDNIVSMSSSQSQSTYANRVYAFGAARNLPSGYKNDADADITKDGVVEKRLMLPNSAECSDKNKQLLAENGFELKNGYIQVSGLREDQYVEGVTTNDDIYPRNLIKTSKVTSYEKDVEDESTPEEGDFIKRTFYRVNSLSIINEDGEKTGDMAFRKSYILSGKNLHIVFQSGSLNGMDFECEFNPDGVEEILKDDDGNPILKDGKEQINPKSQVFEIVANEDYGRFLPDTTLHPKEGDTFVLYNWDSTKLGDTLVSAASNELLTDAIKDLKKSMIDPTTYTCTAEANYSYNQGRGNLHGVGDRVNLYNKGYGDSYRASRIIGYEFCLDIPYDGAKYYVGEKPSYSRLNAMESKIEELVYNGQSYLNGNGGGGKSIYIIKSYDKTAPTDYNVYSARAIDEQRLNKTKDDTAQGTITFEKVQKFLKGMKVGANGDWTLDELDNTHLTIDYLQVRMKAIFETLEILHTDTLGGELFITSVGSNRILKVEEVNITYDGVSQKAYRCYFLGEQDGSKVENKWKVGDQARSKSFNLTQGKYHNVGNHYYWRLVIGVSSEAVEIDGKKYHYVDLSDIDKDAASDEPMVDDILNQCGNRTDITRQSCLVFSAVDTYSPCITLYHGVDGYTFNNKEYVNYGVNHSTNKAFFHVYGDMYFGDRPTSANNYEGDSYVKYDSDKKKVTIKGDLDIKSTYDGKTLDKYITEKSLDKNAVETIIKKSETITDLQNQIDGAIETWFYDGVPTLSNAPAIGWTTDKDKKTHLGDLYYDNKTGKAYRFAKDGSTYKWIIITDTELTKAIEDSSQALKDAKSKRRIFGSQPVPPYDVNDMWVNATYPSDGSTYKNEILKCSSSKAEGEEFDIADWKLASKYTDDTKAEEAKKAAEKAQAEIKNTQTNLIALGTTVSNNKKAFDVFTSDGYLDSSEIAAIAQDSKRLEDDYNAAVESYNNVVGSKFLLDKDGKETTYKTDLVSAKATLDSAKNELITYLSDIVSRYNASDSNGKATIKAAAAQKYTNFTNAYKAFYDKLGVANNYITSNLFDGLNTKLITNMAGLEYIKAALVDGDTVVKGGLILSTLIALRNDKGNVTAGINGADTKENGIALWLGGKAIDKQASTTTEEEKKIAAKSLLRFDGTGYFANGNLWWDADGTLHADPTSFIINKNNVGVQLALFAPVWKSGTTDTTKLANVLSIDPQKPFTHLDVSGNVTTEGSLKIGGIYLSYDSANNALRLSKDAAGKEAANFYTTGGITAYGAGASTTGGGGLIASVISYARILEGSYTDADLTSIPNAYAIKALSSRIDNIATELGGLNLSWNNITGKPSTFTPSAHTHKWTEITDRITKVSQLTNDKGYLTAHQSLASYYTKAEIDAKGYTTNKGTVTSVALTLPTGLTCATKTITTSGTFAISLASGYSIPTTTKQTAWDGAVSAKHTHSNKSVLDDISSTKVSRWNSAYDWYALMTTDEETADGIINKWNEVVSFLANIAQTDTLSGIVDGINKSISDEVTRAKKAEGVNASGISTNKTSITTLQGYFTSGSAKKALQLTNTHKLWGNSFNGTADINGSIIVPDGKYISIGNIKMEYDATNKALKITNTTTNEVANLYTSGGVSAYGVGTSSSSGGGLNGSVKSYSNALKLTSESLSEIASAYSIKALDSRISSLEGGSAMDVSVSGSGNAVTSISKSGTTISVVKGATFLTAHQSLSAYMKTADAKALFLYHTRENIVTDLDNFITNGASHIYELHNVANAPTDNSWLQVMNWGSIDKNYGMLLANDYSINGNLYFRQKVAGKWEAWKTLIDSSNIASQSVKYATTAGSANAVAWTNVSGRPSTMKNPSALSWSGYSTGSYDGSAAKSISIPNNTNQLTNGAGFITASASITGNAATATKVNHSLSVFGKSFNGSADVTVADTDLIASISTGTANLTDKTEILTSYASDNGFNDSNAKNKIHRRPASAIWGYINSKTISNADKLDNVHLNGIFTALSNTNNGVSMTIGTVAKSLANMQVYSATKLQTPRTIWGQSFDGTGNVDGTLTITNSGSDDPHIISTVATWFHIVSKYKLVLYAGDYNSNQRDAINILSNHNVGIGVDPSYKLHVAGDIYSSSTIRTAAQNKAIVLSNDSSPAWISALDGRVIFNIGKDIRFGETAWDWNEWAGLKYTHSNKTIYLGIADGSAFYANNPQSNGTLKFPGITTITPDSGARIGGSGGDLYLGNGNNSNYVKVQDMCSQASSAYWKITQSGNASFKSLNVDNAIACGSITINGDTHINGLLTARATMFTTADSNVYGTSLQNWDGSIGANVTNMFNGIDMGNIQVEYSMDNGASWNTYPGNPENRFNLVNDNVDIFYYYLGCNNLLGNTDADKLAQIKKNQLRVTVKVPNEAYQELSWISVDVDNGVTVKCQVYFGNSSGAYTEYVSKVMNGCSHTCDICVGPSNVNVGNDTYRYVRLVFSHLSSHTALRNGIINRIRALALTKYAFNDGRYTLAITGHIYNYDAYMNTYFPNNILAKGGVTAYQSSDIRLKTNITKLNCLNVIKSIGGTYEFDYIRDHKHSIGFIAQNVNNPLLKDIVAKDDNGYLKINYWNPKLISLAFGALTEIDDEVDKLKARVRELESEVEYLKNKDYVLQ